jgi:hypothetical protein
VNPLAGQDEHETLETLFRNVDLSFAKAAVHDCFHTVGPMLLFVAVILNTYSLTMVLRFG